MFRQKIKVLSKVDSQVIFSMGRMNTLHQIVFELVENSYDSGATRIDISIQFFPQACLEVLDNGCGISPRDFPLVGTLNATSKENAENQNYLNAAIPSFNEKIPYLGNKGEALYCLSTLGKLSVTSRHEPFFTALTAFIQNGKQDLLKKKSSPGFTGRGTKILVDDIFYNLPIRKKILELTKSKEIEHIKCELRHYCLKFPGVAVSFKNGSNKVFSYKRALGLKEGFQQCFPDVYSESMSLIERKSKLANLELLISSYNGPFKVQLIFFNKMTESILKLERIIKTTLGAEIAKNLAFVFDIKVASGMHIHSFSELLYETQEEILGLVSSALLEFSNPIISKPSYDHIPLKRPKYSETSRHNVKFNLPLRIMKTQLKESRIIGQLDRKYILCMVSKTIVVFDQHAVHERIRLEWFQQQLSSDKIFCAVLTPPLVFSVPRPLCYSEDSFSSLDCLKKCGFDVVTHISHLSMEFRVNSIPRALLNKFVLPDQSFSGLPSYNLELILRKCILDLTSSMPLSTFQNCRPKPIDDLLATVACRGAIRFNDYLSPEQCKCLVDDLALCEFPFQCAHGRPTLVPITKINE